MEQGILPLDWSYIGALLANKSEIEQVKFFKSFLNEMRSWGTNHQIQLQLIAIAKNLEGYDRELLSIFCNQHGKD